MAEKEEPSTELAPEIRSILRENRELKQQIKGYKGRMAVLDKQKAETQVAQAPANSTEAEIKPAEAPPKHFVHNSDRFCTDCGGPSPAWKDETECSSCKRPLGSIAGMKLAKSCPDCGSTKFSAKRALTDEEKKLFVIS